MKIKKGDMVQVISWKEKKKIWKVLKILPKTNRVLVEWIKVVKRHLKKMWTTPWQIISKENPIDLSNVMLVCPFVWKPTRVWYIKVKEWEKIKKYRFSKTWLKEKGWKSSDFLIK